MIATTLLIVAIMLIAAFSLNGLAKNTNNIHRQIDDFQARAVAAKTSVELAVIRKELVVYANTECWHVLHRERARQVLSYINGRRDTAVLP